MLVAFIVCFEIAFWILLGIALVTRYLLHLRSASTVLLCCLPLVDLALLVVTAVDLHRGTTATAPHGLAAVYIGFSIAFGHTMTRWADQRFAHGFAGGPPPWKPPKRGWGRAGYEWREFGKGLLGAAVSCVLLLAATAYVGDTDRTEALTAWFPKLGLVMLIWFVAFPVWDTVRAATTREPDRTPS